MKRITLLGLLPMIAAFAQEPKFGLADVHVSTTSQGFAQNFGGVLRGGKYVNRDATMLQLIEAAYDVKEDNVSGGPGWLSNDLFDVVAKIPDGTTPATANMMLQALLADRFKLVVHHGTSPVPRYVVSVGKGGSKLKPASGAGDSGCQQQGGGAAPRGGRGPVDLASLPNIKYACRNMTPAAIGENLRQLAGGYVDHDVVDGTKLEGSWDFDLEWTARQALVAKGAEGISLFSAVEKQLGLKLELQDVPMPSLVIDSVNRMPTANPEGTETALAIAPARFEAASIKPAEPNGMVGLIYTGGSQMRAGGTLRQLISMALQIPPNVAGDMLIGIPKSVDSQAWEIVAKVPMSGEGAPNVVNGRPQPPPLSVGLEMLHGLLLDRFELKTHTENREVTVYALTVGSSKPKLTQADESERSGCKPDPNAPKPVTNMGPMIGCKNTTMAELAQNLARMANAYIDHPIVDATGLQGGWDFAVGWTPRGMLQTPPAPNPNQPPGAMTEAAADPSGISVFEAVEKELGLKLVKQKQSVPVIVVDHVNEKPVE